MAVDVGARMSLRGVARFIAQSRRVQREMNELQRETRASIRSQRRLDRAVGTSISSFGFLGRAGHAAMVGIGVAAGATALAVGGIVRQAYTLTSEFERVEIGFETMLGSQALAQGLIGDLREFAKTTPFNFQELTRYTQRLIGLGIPLEEIISLMTVLGDVTASVGGGDEMLERLTRAYGEMRALGRVNARDAMQFVNAGIPFWEIIAEGLGMTVGEARDASQAGDIAFADIEDILLEGLTQRGAGAMDRMASTLAGRASNLRDAIEFGLVDAFRPFATPLADRVGNFTPMMELFMFGVGGEVERLVDPLMGAIDRLLLWFGNNIDRIVRGVGRVVDLLIPLLESGPSAFLEQLGTMLASDASVGQFFANLWDFGVALADFFVNIVAPAVGELAFNIIDLANVALPILTDILGFLSEHGEVLIPILAGIMGTFFTAAAITKVVTMATAIWGLAGALLGLKGAAAGGAAGGAARTVGGLLARHPLLALFTGGFIGFSAAANRGEKKMQDPTSDAYKHMEDQFWYQRRHQQNLADPEFAANERARVMAGVPMPHARVQADVEAWRTWRAKAVPNDPMLQGQGGPTNQVNVNVGGPVADMDELVRQIESALQGIEDRDRSRGTRGDAASLPRPGAQLPMGTSSSPGFYRGG